MQSRDEKSMMENIPDVLTDGKLYRAAANEVVGRPMRKGAEQVIDAAAEVQKAMNEAAGIGINAIRPEINDDQINGIITGICNAEDFQNGSKTFFDQIGNFLEGTVDDCVKENAEFQYQAGLSPRIERRADAKCCSWCSALAGIYDYEDVRDSGNDVYRRHNNCHCQVLFDPGDGSKRRQNVHTKAWTNEERDDRIAIDSRSDDYRFNSKADPMQDAFGPGELSNPKEIADFRKEADECRVQIIEKEYESLGYSPGMRKGQPGELHISNGASYSAWCHEIQHMRDDRAAGWSGFGIIENREECYRREKRAYKIEIDMAEKAGRKDIADRLRENLESERRRIYGLD